MGRARVHWVWVVIVLAPGLGIGLGGVASGCDQDVEFFTCDDPIINRKDHTGHFDPCCEVDPCPREDGGANAEASAEDTESGDAGDGGPPCSGACVARPPYDWQDPGLVWFGPPGAEPECPSNAQAPGFDGFEGVEAEPATCGCFCTAPEGTCGLTTTFIVRSAACAGPVGVLTPFDAPSGWDGSCTNYDAIPAGALCNGAPCVRSLTAAPLTVLSEQPCAPAAPEPLTSIPPPKVKAAVRACRPSLSFCGDTGVVCAPSAPGFKTCIYQQGDIACPAPYSDKHVVVEGFEDDRHCTSCSCGPPSGGLCTAMLNVSTDNSCGTELLSNQISSSGPVCFDIAVPGVPLGSKSISDLQYVPGSCAVTGGASVGGVTPTGTATFCCLP